METVAQWLGIVVVVCPALLIAVFGVPQLVGRPLSERVMAFWIKASVVLALLAAVGVLIIMLATGSRRIGIELGNWVTLPIEHAQAEPAAEHFQVHIKFVFDRLSVPWVILTCMLVGTIGAFANQYLHRDSGYGRFFLFYALFFFGMIVALLAGTIETLFLGWELVGLSSALLVAYFHQRLSPIQNGQRVWSVYRVADAALLFAAVAMHHQSGQGDFDKLLGAGSWPEGHATMTVAQATFVGLLILIAAAGKSGLVPFSGWLPRAMEGPTPSSAVFYGALSVHLGVYLLLRISPILEVSIWLRAAVVALGVTSALFGWMAARVQSDVKTALAFASVTQVGIITVEIGLGLWYVALVHMIGHACLRTLQLLRAPTLLHDYHQMENAIGGHLHHGDEGWSRRFSPSLKRRLYAWALERGALDEWLDAWFVRPVVAVFRWCNSMEERWTSFLSGESGRDEIPAGPFPEIAVAGVEASSVEASSVAVSSELEEVR